MHWWVIFDALRLEAMNYRARASSVSQPPPRTEDVRTRCPTLVVPRGRGNATRPHASIVLLPACPGTLSRPRINQCVPVAGNEDLIITFPPNG